MMIVTSNNPHGETKQSALERASDDQSAYVHTNCPRWTMGILIQAFSPWQDSAAQQDTTVSLSTFAMGEE